MAAVTLMADLSASPPPDQTHAASDVSTRPDSAARPTTPDLSGRLRDHLGLALEAGGLGAWEWDIRGERVIWDATLEAIYGLEPGQFSGDVEDYRSRVHPDDRDDVAASADDARRQRRGYETEHRIVLPDGTVRWTHSWARPLLDPDGGLIAFIGVVADVTGRRLDDEERDRILAAESAARAEAEAARRDAERAARQYEAVGAVLQRSLLPAEPPDIPGLDVATSYHPALGGLVVGGDFYDVARVGRRNWALLLGDVSGKGAAAAAVTGLVRYTARAAAAQSAGPAAVLRQVNDILRRDQDGADDPRFATMLFARLRPGPGSLGITFALGGHPRPYVVRANGTVETPGEYGTLLGVLTETDFANTKVALTAGDAFVVVTDGVLEARNAERGDLGDYLPALLARHSKDTADKLVAAVEEAALNWRPGPPADDIAIVVLRVPHEERRSIA